MEDEYDFSKGERGRFYRGDRPHHITIHLSDPADPIQYDLVREDDGPYRFQVSMGGMPLMTSDNSYPTKDAALTVLNELRQAAAQPTHAKA